MADTGCSVRLPSSSLGLFVPQFALSGCLLITTALAQTSPSPVAPRPADFGITCTLQDTVGRPVSGLFVEVRSAAPPLELAKAPTLPNGTITFRGLAAGAYNVTVAGGLLLPPKRVQLESPNTTVMFQLPITLPLAPGHRGNTVSVDQLAIPEAAKEALRKAYDAWEKSDVGQSRELATHALQLHPDYGAAISLLGILDLQDGHPADAIASLLRAVHYNPNSPRTYLALASAYNELHQNANALQSLTIMAKLLPDTWQLHYETGRAYLGQGLFDDAIDEFDRAQRLAQQSAMVVHLGKAHALIGLREYPAARAELETVLRKSPAGPYTAESRELAGLLDSKMKINKDADSSNLPKTAAATRATTPPGLEH
jgi:Flp pilus assembly protein TadD